MVLYLRFIAIFLASSLLGLSARAQSLTIQGKVLDGANNPVSGSATKFRVKILAPDGSHCVLFDETHTVDMSGSAGLFSLNLGDGNGVANAPTTYTLEAALSNRAPLTVNSSYCGSGSGLITYTPNTNDNRRVTIEFLDPATMGSAWETIPEMDLNPVAFAMEARTVGGFPASSVLRVIGGGVPGSAPALTTAEMTELQAVIAGTSTKYLGRTSSNGAQLPSYPGAPATPMAGSVWFDSTDGSLKFHDGTTTKTVGTGTGSGTITGVTAGTGLSGGGTSGTVTLNLSSSGVSAGSYGSASSVPVLTVDAQGRVTAASTTAIAGTLPTGTSGQFLRSNGTAWSSQSIVLSDLKSTITGDLFSSPGCTAAQALYWDSGTDTIRCQNIGALDAAAITTGTLSASLLPAHTGDVTSSAGSAALTLANSGVGAGTYKSVTVDAKGRVTAGTNPTTLSGYGITDALNNTSGIPTFAAGNTAARPTAGTAGRLYVDTQALTLYRDNGTTWDVIGSAGAGGSLTGVTAGAGLSGGGSSGNVTVSMPNVGTAGTYPKVTTDAQGRVTGGSALVAADIPSLDWAKIGTGKPTTLSGYGITDALVSNAGGALSIAAGNTAGRGASSAAGRIYIDTQANTVSYDTGSGWQTITSGGGFTGSLSGDVTGTQSATVVSQVGGVTAANVASGANAANAATNLNTASTIVKRDASGNFSAGAISHGSAVFRDGTTNTIGLAAPASVTSYNLTLPAAAPASNGQVLSSTTGGVLSWSTPAAATSVSVTAPVTNSGTATAPNIGMPAASGSVDGYLSSANFTTFTNKLSNALTSAMIFVGNGSNVATGVAPSGDVSMTNAGAFTVNAIKGKTVTAAPTTAGQVLRYDGTNLVPNFVSMGDLRSTVTGASALTTGCTAGQTLTWNSGTDNLQCQNISIAASTQISGVLPVANGGTGANSTSQGFVLAGPATGGAGAPAFRALAASDLPASASYWSAATGGINYAGGNVGVGTATPAAKLQVAGDILADTKISIGSSAYADLNILSNGTIYQNGGDPFTRIQSGGAGNARVLLQSNGPSGGPTVANHEAGRIDIGGRTPGGWIDQTASIKGVAEALWTNASTPMALTFSSTTGTTMSERMRIAGNGNVGIGTNNPQGSLSVLGSSTTIPLLTLGSSSGATGPAILSASNSPNRPLASSVLGFAQTQNYSSGAGEVDFWNTYFTATTAFSFKQQTGAAVHTDLMTILSSGNTGIGSAAPSTKLDVAGTIKIADGGETCTLAANGGMIRYNAGSLQFCNGSAWQTLGVSGAGLTSLGGQTGSTQTFANGTAGTAPAFSSGSNVHTLNIPMASTASVTAGLLSKTDYDAFAAKLGTSTTFGGDVSGTYNATSVDKIKGNAVSNAGLASGQFLKFGGTTWAGSTLSFSDLLNTSASSAVASAVCTAGQTMYYDTTTKELKCQNSSIAAATQITGVLPIANGGTGANSTSQGFVFAGPASGGAGAPSFRALAASDLPASASYWTAATGGINYAGGNVGIGTSAPNALLDLRLDNSAGVTRSRITNAQTSSGTQARYDLATGTPNAYAISAVTENGAGVASYELSTGDGITNGMFLTTGSTATNLPIVLRQASNERMRVHSNGNIGIGTNAPSSKLEIGSGDLRIASGNLLFSGVGQINGSGTGLQVFSGANPLQLGAGNVEKVRIDSSGNVGIGTTAPTAAVHLKAGGTAASSAPLKFTTSAGSLLATPENGAMEYDGANYYLTVGTTRMAIPLAGGTASYSTVSAGAGTAAAPSHSFSGDNDTGFFSSAANTIGLSAGGTKVFDVSSAGLVSPTTGGAAVASANGTATAPTYSFAGDLGTGWFRAAASTLAASTGGTERMRIDSAGNVGIGTTSAGAMLHVNSTALIGSSSANQTNVSLNGGGPANTRNLTMMYTSGGTNGSMAGDYATIQAGYGGVGYAPLALNPQGGSIGIGTTAPTSLLHVNGKLQVNPDAGIGADTASYSSFGVTRDSALTGTPSYFAMTRSGTTVWGQGINSTNSAWTLGTQTATASGFGYVDVPKLTVTPSGNLGIGTTSPNARISFGAYSTNASGAAPSHIRLYENGTDVYGLGISASQLNYFGGGGAHVFYNGAIGSEVERMRIIPNGNVGIGTASPDFKLVVAGGANGARFTTTDFVQGSVGSNVGLYTGANTGTTYGAIQAASGGGGTPNMLAINPSGGNVGIGTTNTGAKLDVRGGIFNVGVNTATSSNFMVDPSSTSQGFIRFTTDSSANYLQSGLDGSSGSVKDFRISPSLTTSPWLTIQGSSGNVGIGTMTPGNKFEIKTAAANTGLSVVGNANAGETTAVNIYANLGPGAFNPLTRSGDMVISYSGTTINNPNGLVIAPWTTANNAGLRMDAAGKVGIGTFTPASSLDVNGVGAFPLTLRSTSYAGTNWQVGPWSGTNHFYIIDENSVGMYLTKGSGATGWTVNSDRRLKTRITPLNENSGLAAILKLKPVTYHWRDQRVSQEEQTGFIAQEVEAVLPNLVTHGRDSEIVLADGTKELVPAARGVNYTGLVVPLVKAVQELQKQIWDIVAGQRSGESRLAKVEAESAAKAREIASLKEANLRLQREMEALKAAKEKEAAAVKARLDRLEKLLAH